MKNTIKADNKRQILKEEYLNDNALLELTLEGKNDVVVALRYVQSPIKGIQEQILTKISTSDCAEEYDELVKISADKSTIAIFKKTEENYELDKLYDTEEHTFIPSEFLDIVYLENFPNSTLDKHLVIKNTK